MDLKSFEACEHEAGESMRQLHQYIADLPLSVALANELIGKIKDTIAKTSAFAIRGTMDKTLAKLRNFYPPMDKTLAKLRNFYPQ